MKKLSTMLFAVILMCSLFIQSYAIKYTDGRFITNTKVHEFVKDMIEHHKDYKEFSERYKIYFERINFSFMFDKQNDIVKKIGLRVPVVDQNTAVTFFIYLYPKKGLSCFELVNLLLNSNDFNDQDFNFGTYHSVNIGGWCGDAVNEYDDKYSIATDITEENWQEKFLDPHMLWGCGPRSLLFFEIRPGEKVFVEAYDENFDE